MLIYKKQESKTILVFFLVFYIIFPYLNNWLYTLNTFVLFVFITNIHLISIDLKSVL